MEAYVIWCKQPAGYVRNAVGEGIYGYGFLGNELVAGIVSFDF